MHYSKVLCALSMILTQLVSCSTANNQVLLTVLDPTFTTALSLPASPSKLPTLKELIHLDTHISLDYNSESHANSSNQILSNILSLTNAPPSPPLDTITSISISGYDFVGNWTLVENVFPLLSNLKFIHWGEYTPITTSILKSIEQTAPNAKLFYTLKSHSREMSKPHSSIINSTNLYSLNIELDYSNPSDNIGLPIVFSTLATSPNARELSIKLSSELGCDHGYTPYAFNFTSHPNVTFPPLEVLKVDGYGFDFLPDGSYDESWRRRFDKTYAPPSDNRTNVEHWKQAMDFTKLHTLSLTGLNANTLSAFKGDILPSLKHLHLNGWFAPWEDTKSPFLDFVQNVANPLSSLFLERINTPFENITHLVLARHSSTLAAFKYEPLITLPSPHLTALLTACTKLQTLDISIPRPSPLPHPAAERPESGLNHGWDARLVGIPELAPGIKHLKLRFPSPPEDWNPVLSDGGIDREAFDARQEVEKQRVKDGLPDLLDTTINKNTSLRLFKSLRKGKKEGPMRAGEKTGSLGVELDKLDVYMGEWDDRDPEDGPFIGRTELVRVAFYECFVDCDGEEICEGSQTRTTRYAGEPMEYIS